MTDNGTHERNLSKLRRDFGDDFLKALSDPSTVEIILNADGALWQERLGEPLKQIGTMSASCADAAMRTIAAYHHAILTRESPSIECELPLDGSRFACQIPPMVTAPVFAVRKRASKVFTLQQYVEAGIMTTLQLEILTDAIRDHRNILISGSVGSGKSTLINALIRELTDQYPNERLIIIEDTAELQCAAKDFVQYHTTPERSMTDIVRTSLRMRPDRVLVGEVRGEEALDLLMTWNLGNPGGFATVHANDARSSLTRIETLVSMHPRAPRDIPRLVGEVQPILVHMARTKGGRVVREILDVRGFGQDGYQYQD